MSNFQPIQDPYYEKKYFEAALSFEENGKIFEAERIYLHLLKFNKKNYIYNFFLGTLYLNKNDFRKAIKYLSRAIDLNKKSSRSYYNRALAYQNLKLSEKAIIDYKKTIDLEKSFINSYINIAYLLRINGKFDESLFYLNAALDINNDNHILHHNTGSLYYELGRLDEALTEFSKALELAPNYADSRFCRSQILLLKGDFSAGWSDYEARKFSTNRHGFFVSSKPLWTGSESLISKTIFIYSEQGLGDTIQFSRYLHLLHKAGARILFLPQQSLSALMGSIKVPMEILSSTPKESDYDFHAALLSLPFIFSNLKMNGTVDIPYLFPDEDHVKNWHSKIGADQFKIGISWQGGNNIFGTERSFPLQQICSIAQIPSVRLISLQKGFGVEQIKKLPRETIIQVLDDFDDGPHAFIDTAAVMHCLDLVITADTSIAHLAGAMGIPTWIALKQTPDWRWMLERADSHWYPSVKLFRQKKNNSWDAVFQEMKEELINQLG